VIRFGLRTGTKAGNLVVSIPKQRCGWVLSSRSGARRCRSTSTASVARPTGIRRGSGEEVRRCRASSLLLLEGDPVAIGGEERSTEEQDDQNRQNDADQGHDAGDHEVGLQLALLIEELGSVTRLVGGLDRVSCFPQKDSEPDREPREHDPDD